MRLERLCKLTPDQLNARAVQWFSPMTNASTWPLFVAFAVTSLADAARAAQVIATMARRFFTLSAHCVSKPFRHAGAGASH